MKNLTGYIITISMMALATMLHAQGNFGSCKEELRTISRAMGDVEFPEDDQVYYLSYNIRSVMWENEGGPIEDLKVEMLMSKDQLHYLAGDITVLQDMKDAFMIINSRKMILWSTSTVHRDRKHKVQEMIAFRDTLLNICQVKTCEPISINGKIFRRMVLQPEDKAGKALQVAGMEILYSPGEQWIEKVIIDHTLDNEVKRTEITYNNVKYDFKAKMKRPVADLILARNNQLNSRYSGYQLIDNR